jgi:hypothetical protein
MNIGGLGENNNTQVEVFWVMMLCSVAGEYQHFGGP